MQNIHNLFRFFNPKKERRRRIKRPKRITLIALSFILAPLLTTIYNLIFLAVPLNDSFRLYNPISILLLMMAPLVGIGILQVKRWGWYFFLSYIFIIILYNIDLFVAKSNVYYGLSLVQTTILSILAAFFLKHDISAPYFSVIQRGFRRGRRKKMRKIVYIANSEYKTIDISKRGILICWPNCKNKLGDEIKLKIYKKGKFISGGIVRIDDSNVGIAFRN